VTRRAPQKNHSHCAIHAAETVRCFDTDNHCIAPELSAEVSLALHLILSLLFNTLKKLNSLRLMHGETEHTVATEYFGQ
jgi:hypothetical protein